MSNPRITATPPVEPLKCRLCSEDAFFGGFRLVLYRGGEIVLVDGEKEIVGGNMLASSSKFAYCERCYWAVIEGQSWEGIEHDGKKRS